MKHISDFLPLGIQGYERKTPAHQRALYIVAVIALIVIYLTR